MMNFSTRSLSISFSPEEVLQETIKRVYIGCQQVIGVLGTRYELYTPCEHRIKSREKLILQLSRRSLRSARERFST